VINAKPTA